MDPEQFGYGEPDVDENGNPYVDIYFEAEAAKPITGAAVPAGHSARLRMYTKADQKKAVIERDTDNLTSAEIEKHSREVEAAIYEELKIWIEHKYFERRPRKGARNILDVRWVYKWKWVKSTIDPSKQIRIIIRKSGITLIWMKCLY